MGGLGNQMFQIATAYAHALRNKFPCGFDLYNNNLPLQGNPAYNYKSTLYGTLSKITLADYNLEPYPEHTGEYRQIPAKDNIILKGYFQSYKYFDDFRDEILELFLNDEARYSTLMRLNINFSVELHDSVSVHIRRGDYLKFPNNHPIPDMAYYIDALLQIKKEADVRCILVFSDDIKWCKEHFNAPQARFIEGLPDCEDMLLMSLCNHNILANSSFSWWGAYLNQNPQKIVYAPKKWFGTAVKHSWSDIYLPTMRVI